MVECEVCVRTFVNWHAARQHMDAVGHWGCETCNAEFWTQDAADDHMESFGHFTPKYDCEGCNASFETLADAKRHMHANGHWRAHWCNACNRGFESQNNLNAHLNSSTHRSPNSITCPFCKRGYTTATGVTHHLETGSCPNARSLNRDTILTEIRRRDPNHIITKKLLTYTTSSTITTTSASYNARTGFYECYICHKGFMELKSLNNHVNSPAHKDKVYHCPGRGCGREFRALAPLFNHLESETCGAVRFDTVQKNVGGILSGRRLIGFS